MHMVDTKMLVPKTIHKGEIYTRYEKAPSLNQAKRARREILAGFSKKTAIPLGIAIKQLEKMSSVDVYYKKASKGYSLWIRPKKDYFPLVHPVVLQKKHGGRWF